MSTVSSSDSAEAEVTAACCTPDLIQDEDWFHGRLVKVTDLTIDVKYSHIQMLESSIILRYFYFS